VVTGNARAVAEIKLQVFALDNRILWDLGAAAVTPFLSLSLIFIFETREVLRGSRRV
jgi:hypothetical protein